MLAERLLLSRTRLGMSQRKLAAAMGGRYDQTMISKVESGRSGLGGEGLSKAATALGVSIDYLFGLTNEPAPVFELVEAAYRHGSRSSNVAWIPKIAAVVGAERGEKPYDTTVVEYIPFSNHWLMEREINPQSCHFVTVQGDLMEPTLPDGCTILVDTSRQEYQHDHIYVMQYERQIIKRMSRFLTPVRLRIKDNPMNGEIHHDWYPSFDNRGGGPPPYLQEYDVKAVFGEVMRVERFL